MGCGSSSSTQHSVDDEIVQIKEGESPTKLVLRESKDGEYNYLLKFVVIGCSNVGKSNLVLRYSEDSFYTNHKATIGVEFKMKTITVNEKVVKLQLWDTAGQERYKAITSAYYRGSHGALLVYDITSIESYNSISKWLDEIDEFAPNSVKILVGNKTDLEEKRQVDVNLAMEFAEQKKILFI